MSRWVRRAVRHLAEERAGRALLSIMLAAALVMAAGLAVLSEATTNHGISSTSADWESAYHLAWAGVEHSLALMNASFPTFVGPTAGERVLEVPATALGPGSYTSVVTALGENRFQIHSSGTARSRTRELRAVLAFRHNSGRYFHIYSARSFSISGESRIYGDLYSAEDIALSGTTKVVDGIEGSLVTGSVIAQGKVTLGGSLTIYGDVVAREVQINGSAVRVHGQIRTGYGPFIPYPRLDLRGVKALTPTLLTTSTLDCDATPLAPPCQDGGYYTREGNLSVKGSFRAPVVIAVENGELTVNGHVTRRRDGAGNLLNPHALIALVSDTSTGSSIKVKPNLNVEALLYTGEQVLESGSVETPGKSHVYGAIITYQLINGGSLNFRADTEVTDQLPGLPGVHLMVVEWIQG